MIDNYYLRYPLELLYHNERYWFDSEEEAIMTESNREFEQSPAIEQLFMVYYRGAEEEEEGEWLLAKYPSTNPDDCL